MGERAQEADGKGQGGMKETRKDETCRQRRHNEKKAKRLTKKT